MDKTLNMAIATTAAPASAQHTAIERRRSFDMAMPPGIDFLLAHLKNADRRREVANQFYRSRYPPIRRFRFPAERSIQKFFGGLTRLAAVSPYSCRWGGRRAAGTEASWRTTARRGCNKFH